MTQADRILSFLANNPGWFSDNEISERLGVYPRQAVNQVVRRLSGQGLIRRELLSGILRNSSVGGTDTHRREPRLQRPPSGGMTPSGFEHLAREAMSAHFGAPLAPGTIAGVPKKFDLVSADGSIVGNAKYFTLVRGERLPPAKFSVIAEYVWLLQHAKADQRFLVFGNDRRVPERWLPAYGHLASGVDFFFLDPDQGLSTLN